jgi:hypothetical protein
LSLLLINQQIDEMSFFANYTKRQKGLPEFKCVYHIKYPS